MRIQIAVNGVTSLLMHNPRLSDPLDEISRQLKTVTAKRKKTDEDHEEMARLEHRGGIYYREDIGPYVPAEAIKRSIQDGAKLTKDGKNVERALVMVDDAPLVYEGPRDPDALWQARIFTDRRSAGVGPRRVMRTRPRFDSWAFVAEAELISDMLDPSDLQRFVSTAGQFIGILDFRPTFGRYEGKVIA